MGEALRARAPELSGKVATRTMPDFVVKLLALFVPAMKQVRSELGKVIEVDGSAHRRGSRLHLYRNPNSLLRTRCAALSNMVW